MRNLINLFLTEMPISSLEVRGIDDPESTSFSKTDRMLLSSPKGRMKIVRAFRNTPFNFEIFFVANDQVDGDDVSHNDDVDRIARRLEAGVHDRVALFKGQPTIEGKSGVIRIVMLANLSPTEAKMPMTGWTLAHKVGHAIQDSYDFNARRKRHVPDWTQWVMMINQLVNDISGAHEGYESAASTNYEYPAWISEYLTMKSARDGKLTNGFETFAEMVAQYLITGSVAMKVNPRAQEIVNHLNDCLAELFKSVVGKVLVEV